MNTRVPIVYPRIMKRGVNATDSVNYYYYSRYDIRISQHFFPPPGQGHSRRSTGTIDRTTATPASVYVKTNVRKCPDVYLQVMVK